MPLLTEMARKLREGGVVAFPTETVYGLGASIRRIDALDRVFELKGRPDDNPLIVHISDMEMLKELTPAWSDERLARLAKVFWPGPLTVIVPRLPMVPDRVTAGLDTVAVRMPDHPMALELIRQAGPLAAPSANRSGRPSPTRADHVREDFGDAVDVLNGGTCRVGLESTVVDLSSTPVAVLRPGGVSAAQIEAVLGEPVTLAVGNARRSPGTRYRHYAPTTPVVLLPPGSGGSWGEALTTGGEALAGLLTFAIVGAPQADGNPEAVTAGTMLIIAPDAPPHSGRPGYYGYGGNYGRLAAELYDRFRQADLDGLSRVVVVMPSDLDHPLYAALANRIEKAAGILGW